MNNKLNPNEAPPGYVATPIKLANRKGDGPIQSCSGCAFDSLLSCTTERDENGCTNADRVDGHNVIFIKRPEPTPLDARLTIRLPASVKAKAQRIGATAVIAAIEAVQE